MIHDEVDRGTGNDGRELLQDLDRLEEQMRGAIAPDGRQRDEDASVGPELDAVLGERGAEEVAAELLEAGTIVRGDPDVGVEIEAIELGLTRAAGGDVTQVRLVAEAADAGAGAGAEGDAALDGGTDKAGQDGGGVGERVRRGGVVSGFEVAAGEQPPHAGADRGEDVRHVLVAREGGRVEGEVPGSGVAEDAVEHERVEVDVQLQAAPEALDHRHRAGLALRDAVRPRGARVEGEQPAGIHAQHGAAQGVIPRQAVAQAIRQCQDPLAHRDQWQHLVDERGGTLRHASPPTARAEAAPLARAIASSR